MTGDPPPSKPVAERVRRLLAVPVAFLACALGVLCLVSVPEVTPRLADLALVDGYLIGWSGAGAVLGLLLAVAALLLVGRIGSGPALALGAAGSVFGLGLGNGVVDPVQISVGLLMLGGSAGCLLGGAASMAFELPASYRPWLIGAWTAPVMMGWPLTAWLARHVAAAKSGRPSLTVYASGWSLAAVVAVIVFWGVLTMLVEPERTGVRSGRDWEPAWSGLLATAVGGGLAIALMGFDPALPVGWLRSLVLLSTAVVVVGLTAATLLVPVAGVRVGYACLAFVALCFPVSISLLVVVADGGRSRVSWWLALLLSLTTGVGAVLGAWRPRWAPQAFLVVAVGCAGTWVMPGTPLLMAVGAVPLCLGAGAVFGSGARLASASAVGWRFAAMAVIAIILLGTVAMTGLGWALGGDVPADTASARAAGRVLLGSTFALAVLAAAVVSVLAPVRRVDEQPTTPLPTTEHRESTVPTGNSGILGR